MSQNESLALDALPDCVTAYLTASSEQDIEAKLAAFTPDATVVDDGRTYVGVDDLRAWMRTGSSEYTYTITPTAATRLDESRYAVVQHLEGNFPGGVVDLQFRFTTRDSLIEYLVIEP